MSNTNEFTPESNDFMTNLKNILRHPGLGMINLLRCHAITLKLNLP